MSGTPTLTLVQQRKSLSAKKQKTKCNYKISLNFAETDNSAIDVPDEDKEVFLKLLKEHLVAAQLPVIKIPWAEIKKLKKEERKEKRKEQSSHLTSDIEKGKQQRNKFFLGVNAVQKGIKSKKINSLILAADIQPKQLVDHLIYQCKQCRVPVVLLSELRMLTKVALGFQCIAVGIKEEYEDTQVLTDKIKSYVTFEAEDEITPQLKKLEKEVKVLETFKPESIYLYRTSKNERVFKPKEIPKPDLDFIKLSDSKDENKEIAFSEAAANVLIRKFIADDDEEIPEVKKKKKKDWVIDKSRSKSSISFRNIKSLKVGPNPRRKNKPK